MDDLVGYQLPEYLRARRWAARRHWGVQIVAIATAVLCLTIAGFLLAPINQIRKSQQLILDHESMKDLPPDLALLGKLGTFRALAIDWASIRAERLKDEGKTYEAYDLHKIVCRLAPRFPTVWVNAAWNMAYNISVMKYTPEERWKWVKNGIGLLRDEGIPFNPQAVSLYKELAWIYWHKVGDFLDDEHLNYKRALAVDMEQLLGPPPDALSSEEYFQWFRKIVDAPRDTEAFLRTDASVAALVVELAGLQLPPNEFLLDFVARNFRPELRLEDLQSEEAIARDPLRAQRAALLSHPENIATVERLLAAVRSKALRERCKFDLDYMLKMMVEDYGPLDWRNAFAHSLYWASLGDSLTRKSHGATRADIVNTARFIFYSLQNMITRGRIILWPNFDEPFESYIEMTPDVRLIPYLHDVYMRLGKEHSGADPRFKEGTPGPTYFTGFVANMQTWIELLFLDGGEENLKLAEKYYVWLRENNPHPDGSTQEQYLKTVEEFVMGDIIDQLQNYKIAGGVIRRFIFRTLKDLALGEQLAAQQNLKRARTCYEYWMTDTSIDINDRRKMQPFRIIVRDEVDGFFRQATVASLVKARLWKELPLDIRQLVFDGLRPYFEKFAAAQTPPWNLARAFPEPAGMDEFRKTPIDYRGDARMKGVDQGELPK